MVEAADGDLYGTTADGGTGGQGTVFKITPGGSLTTLYSFCSQSGCADGSNPSGSLAQGTDGNLYGATGNGGSSTICPVGCGTLFRITPDGEFTSLYSFCSRGSKGGCPDGSEPDSLVQSTNGEFYGTTTHGGASDGVNGTIFSFSVGLGPFVRAQTSSGKPGSELTILGNDLIGSTSVSFNGTAAAFKVVSGSEIVTRVPAGATTGIIQVVRPSGTLSSNVPFVVLP